MAKVRMQPSTTVILFLHTIHNLPDSEGNTAKFSKFSSLTDGDAERFSIKYRELSRVEFFGLGISKSTEDSFPFVLLVLILSLLRLRRFLALFTNFSCSSSKIRTSSSFRFKFCSIAHASPSLLLRGVCTSCSAVILFRTPPIFFSSSSNKCIWST